MNRQKWVRAGIIVFAALAVLVVGIIILRNNDQAQYKEARGQMSEGFGQLKTVEINGKTYREKPAVTTILVCGVDKEQKNEDSEDSFKEYRRGGQADFLLLLAIDHTDKKIHQMQIDRDTMADVITLSIFGKEAGSRVMQICLAHAYGASPEDNAKYTVKAVRNLLGGIEIDGYYVIDYTGIPALNDALGGVTVHLDFDMTSVNPEWEKGKTITLHGKDAETFVRTRQTIGAGTNEERMVRQGEYMRNAISQMSRRIKADLGFADTLVETLKDLSVTNMTTKRLAEELKDVYGYQTLPVDHPAGEYTIGENGLVEFHMEDGAAVKWVLEHMYMEV